MHSTPKIPTGKLVIKSFVIARIMTMVFATGSSQWSMTPVFALHAV
jgi:hypothetical protein